MTGDRLVGMAAIAAVFLAAGCMKVKPPPPPIVEAGGVVMIGDLPLKKVKVRFVPTGDYSGETDAVGVTDDAGKFTLTCRGQPGASLGENVVVVEESDIPPELRGEKSRLDKIKYFAGLGGRPLPKKYGSMATSTLIVNVTADRKNYKIILERDNQMDPN